MDKVKISEIAHELGMEVDDVLNKAIEVGLSVRYANSTINIEEAGNLMDYILTGVYKGPKIKIKGDKMDSSLEEKEKKLKLYHEQLLKEKNSLKQARDDFEEYKKIELQKLKNQLHQKELDHKATLEEEKIKMISNLKEDFLDNIKNEYEKVNSKLDVLTQKELKLIEWQQELDNNKHICTQQEELFNSEKEKLLNEYKQELEQKKEIFHNEQEEIKFKKQEEINLTIKKLYEDKEKELEDNEKELREKDAKLKTQLAEAMAKEKLLETQADSLYTQEKEKVQEEIKNYQEKVESFEKENQKLREELSELRKDINLDERYKDRKLAFELDDKQQEAIRLKNLLEKTTDQKNKTEVELDNTRLEYNDKQKELLKQIETLRYNIRETESLKSENILLEDKKHSFENQVEFLKGENRKLEENLHSIFSQGKEKDLRIEDIKRVPYKEIKLEEEITANNEIKYLDSIEGNMKKYGVEYPKRLLYAFHTALKSADFSPLTVLSGVSGTGKSELPKLYSHFGGFNFLAEAVQPTWDSPESMMGYYNTIENKFDSTNILKFLLQTSQSKGETPYGLKESMNMILLDEMNLAHIELYFAEFLSKFELRRGSQGVNLDIKLGTGMNYPLPLDRNVLWIGTMNEDETTKSLSDKVLDRAFSINFPRPDDLKSRAKLKSLEEIKQFEYLNRKTWDSWLQKESLFTEEKSKIIQDYRQIANEINKHLEPTGRAIGHRVWQSMEYYINNHPLVISNIENEDELIQNVKLAFEEQLVQKIMPKLRGIEVHGKEKEALDHIRNILHAKDFKITEDFELSMDNPYGQFIWNSANYLKED